MATMGLAVAGGAVGSYFGGPVGGQVGYAAGSLLGSYLFSEKPEERFGPRIEDQAVSVATEGADIPIVWGQMRTACEFIWLGALTEHEHKEDVGGKGGPTATQTTYTYTRSFAVDFGAFESQAILRVWANKELIYDVRPEAQASRKRGLKFSLYLGTETQEPDPLMESVIGVGNVSAHRGHTYIVFDAVDVTDSGGRPPSVEAEIITDATLGPQSLTLDVYDQTTVQEVMHWDPYNQRIYAAFVGGSVIKSIIAVADPYARSLIKVLELSTGNRCTCLPFSSLDALEYNAGRNDRLFAYSKDHLQVFDTANMKEIGSYDPGGHPLAWVVETRTMLAFNYNGVFRAWSKVSSALVPVSPAFVAQTLPSGYSNLNYQYGFAEDYHMVKVLENDTSGEFAACRYTPGSTGGSYGTIYEWGELITDWQGIHGIVADTINGCLWALATDSAGVKFLFKISLDGALIAIVSLGDLPIVITIEGQYPLFFDEQTHNLYIHLSTATIYIYDVVAGALSSKAIVHGSAWSVFLPDLGEIWCGEKDDSGRSKLYADQIERVSPNKISAAAVIADICARAGIAASALNLTAVTHELRGYRHSRRVPARADLEPLMLALHLDAVQSDYKLKFVPRGGSAAETLDEQWLGAHTQGDTPPPSVQPTYPQAIDLPRSLDLNYLSIDADLQRGGARAEWISGDAERQESLTLPLVLSDAEAMVLVDQRLQLSAQKDSFAFSLTRRYAALEPTDVVEIPVDGDLVRVRLLAVDRGADGIHRITAELDDPEDLVSYAQAGGGGVTASQILLLSPPQLLVLDGPLLRDIDLEHPGPYLAGFTRSAGYPGAVVYVSADGAAYLQTATLMSEATVGAVTTVPAAVTLDAWDDTNTLAAEMINGALASKTEAEVLAGANAMLWGVPGRWEVIQPATATAAGAGAYDLTHILRGRRGTDWAMGLHETYDWLVLADEQTLARLTLSNADIGNQRWYKLPAVGTPVADANAQSLAVGKQPLMPYAPIALEATFSGSGADLAWVRRTRKGGFYGGTNGLVDGVGGSVSEDTEAWEIDIAKVDAAETVVRTLTASSVSALYAAADMSSDGVPANGPFRAAAYQLSAVVGRGHVREAFLAKTLYDAIAGGNPEAYWRLDETTGPTATDAMGSHNGTISGGVTLNKTGLVSVGTCFGFGAAGDKVETATSAALNLASSWSIGFWVSPTAAGSDRNLIQLVSSYPVIVIRLGTTNALEALVRNFAGVLIGPAASSALSAGTTYGITVTYDGADLVVFVDGFQAGSFSVDATTHWGSGNPKVVIADSGGGDIDEPAVYKRVLSEVEIRGIFGYA